jgi:chromosome segregation ATPase
MIVLMVTTGVCLGLAGGWFGFRWWHKGRVFRETDREYFQNLLYRSESAEAKLETMEPELDRTRDRANILEDSHRIIQEELANERQFNLSLNGDLSRERAHHKFLEDKLTDQSEALEAAQRRIDGALASLAKRIGESTQALAKSLNATRDGEEPGFAAATF